MMKKYLRTNVIIYFIIVSLCITNTFAQSVLPERIINLDFNQVKGPLEHNV